MEKRIVNILGWTTVLFFGSVIFAGFFPTLVPLMRFFGFLFFGEVVLALVWIFLMGILGA